MSVINSAQTSKSQVEQAGVVQEVQDLLVQPAPHTGS